MSDLVLARPVLAGEEVAFEEFFGRYFPVLYRFALARTGNHEDAAEELAQRALIRGLAGLHTHRRFQSRLYNEDRSAAARAGRCGFAVARDTRLDRERRNQVPGFG